MKIQLISLRNIINKTDDALDKASKGFLNSISNLDHNIEFSEDDAATKIFFIETGGSEIKFKKIFKSHQEPYYFLTSDNSNSLASALEILTFLRRQNLQGEIIYGDVNEVAATISSITKITSACQKLVNSNLGVIGKPSDWLIGSSVSYKKAHDLFGVNLIDISEDELIEEINKHTYEHNNKLDNMYEQSDKKDVLNGALEIYGAIKRLVNKYNLQGLTIRCFDLLSIFHNTSCLALALLNEEGITATCEGDIPAFLTMHLARCLLSTSAFQANPSKINVADNIVTFAHCTVPFDMVSSFKFDTHFESNLGIGIKGELNNEECTLIKLNGELTDLYINEGYIIENLHKTNLCRTQINIQLEDDITEYLGAPYGNHMILVYGLHGYDFEHCMEYLLMQYNKKFSVDLK